ncbi:hypothetical protein BC828DRAFT_348908 [Blastocladiella britannica]|nr:hypothetical protein BC828DRAFT_348908 [Blastocladiella britannica]
MRPALLIRSIHQLAEVLRSKSGEFSRVEAITGARVPIIKVVHTQTGIPIDISFNQLSGIQTADLVRRRMTQFPALRPLVMVLKLFLFCRELNEVFNGGISSYTVITMTLAFLRTHPLVAGGVIRAEENLGTLLLDWFHLYGYVQVPGRTAITESGFVPMV